MSSIAPRCPPLAVSFLLPAALAACGSAAQPSAAPGLTISPGRVAVLVRSVTRFTAAWPDPGQGIVFAVVEGADGGSVTPEGDYTAPGVPGEFHVRATSVADPARFAEASVTVRDYQGAMTRLPDPPTARDHHTATLLADGTVLVAGGHDFAGVVAEASRFDPGQRAFRGGGVLVTPRMAHAAERLRDGTVLISGGWDPAVPGTGFDPVFRSSELYDPAAAAFTQGPDMVHPRRHHTATLLQDGRVFVAGGIQLRGSGFGASGNTELYDPAVGAFSAGPRMAAASGRWLHSATLLPDGRVLLAGGRDNNCGVGCAWGSLDTAEIYDPATDTLTPTGRLVVARHAHTAAALPDGRVLVLGGETTVDLGTGTDQVMSVEVYDPATGQFTAQGSLLQGRAHHASVHLADGRYLLVGGKANSGLPSVTTEVYDLASGKSRVGPEMTDLRIRATATRLRTGEVLVLGGNNSGGPVLPADLYH